jgi:hypothetical protein
MCPHTKTDMSSSLEPSRNISLHFIFFAIIRAGPEPAACALSHTFNV